MEAAHVVDRIAQSKLPTPLLNPVAQRNRIAQSKLPTPPLNAVAQRKQAPTATLVVPPMDKEQIRFATPIPRKKRKTDDLDHSSEDIVEKDAYEDIVEKDESISSCSLTKKKRRKNRKKRKRHNKPRDFRPSHIQVGRIVAKCLPHDVAKEFLGHYTTACLGNEKGSPDEQLLMKTRISWINDSLKKCINSTIPDRQKPMLSQVSMLVADNQRVGTWLPEQKSNEKRMYVKSLDLLLEERQWSVVPSGANCAFSRGALEVVLMGVVLNRRLPANNKRCDIQLPNALGEEELSNAGDDRFTTLIALVPSTGFFYCPFRMLKKKAKGGGKTEKVFQPIPIRWLRMKRNVQSRDGSYVHDLFAAGGYVKRVLENQIYRLAIQMRASSASFYEDAIPTAFQGCDVQVIQALQVPQEDGPLLPPDVYVERLDSMGNAKAVFMPSPRATGGRRGYYNTLRAENQTFRRNARSYVSGALHYDIGQDCLVIDPLGPDSISPNFDIVVGVQKKRTNSDGSTSVFIEEETTMEIRLPVRRYTSGVMSLCEAAKEKCRSVAIRTENSFDTGKMVGFGQRPPDAAGHHH